MNPLSTLFFIFPALAWCAAAARARQAASRTLMSVVLLYLPPKLFF